MKISMLRTVALGGVFSVVFSAAALAYVASPNFSVTALTEGGSGAGSYIATSTGANFATGTCMPKSSAASYATSATQTTIGLNSGATTPVIGGGSSGGGIGGGGRFNNVTQSIM